MKRFIILLFAALLTLSSCSKNGNGDSSKFSKSLNFPINPCDYINRKMIVCHLGVSSSKLDLIQEDKLANDDYLQCGFEWKKINYDEIQENRRKVMSAFAMKGNHKADFIQEVSLSQLSKLDSPNNYIKIGHFKKYDSFKSANRSFQNSHISLTKEEFRKLMNESEDKENQEKYFEIPELVGTNFSQRNEDNLKYTEVDGVGDQAFYNHKLKSLDVRFGIISFSVFIDTEFDSGTNILIAKKIAYEVWEKL